MSEAKKRRIRLPKWLIVVIAAVVIFAAGIGYEAYRHSDAHLKSLLESNENSFSACAEYFSGEDVLTRPVETQITVDEHGNRSKSLTSVSTLLDIYAKEDIYSDLKALQDCGIQKITAEQKGSSYEIKFYIDINSGYSYITDECKEAYGYVPEGYFENIHIKGDWYSFGLKDKK